MKKIAISCMALCIMQMAHSQTAWTTGLNTIVSPQNPNFGTASNHPLYFFTNNRRVMSLTQDGILSVNNLSGSGYRFLRADANGALSAWTGSPDNANLFLAGDGSWKENPISSNGSNLYISGGHRFGIGNAEPAAALDVSGDVVSSGVVQASNGFRFTSVDGVNYDPGTNTFIMGKAGAPMPSIDLCNYLPSPTTTGWLQASQGGFVSTQVNPAAAPSVDAALRMYVAPGNGSGYIELNGKDYTGSTNNSLNINNYCGRVTNINTGSNGGNVNMCGAANSNLGVGTTAVSGVRATISNDNIGLDVITNHTADNNYNSRFRVNRDYTKALAVISTANNPSGDENFIVYGDGRTRIGGDYLGGSENYYKLSVGGPMIAEEVVISLRPNWPDYVFSKQHALMPLKDVEQYIQKNSHLPNIPSAAEIREKGLNTGEMMKQQMEKIEELTLYLIDLNKKVDQLQADNEGLRKKIK